MPDLAVIVPYYGENPHLHYTVQAVLTELRWFVRFEVICVHNGPGHGKAGELLLHMLRKEDDTSWLKMLSYETKMSHWQCKNLAVRNTDAPFLFFLDAHCLVPPVSFRDMFFYYNDNYKAIHGSLTLPIADFLRTQAKAYRMLYDPEIGLLHYENEFINSRADIGFPPPIAKPCLSTCGMLCTREIITDVLEYWPEELGSYGGGENFYNFVMARMGYTVNLWPGEPVRHWHIPGVWSRDYQPTYQEWARNIMLATFLVGGREWLDKLTFNAEKLPAWHPVKQGNDRGREDLSLDIITSKSLKGRHERINEKAVISIEGWAEQWTH